MAKIQKIDSKFGELLRYYRQRMSLTQRQLYDELEDYGCDYREKHGASLISRYEKGQRKPPRPTVEAFESILSVPDNSLLKAWQPDAETLHKKEESLIVHGLSAGDTDVEFLVTNEANEQAKKDREAKAEQAPTDEVTEPVAEHKPKRSRKQAVTT